MKIAVVLFNLGGPDSPQAIQPFLFNLFNDPAIIGLPGPLRWLLAKWISSRRAPVAREIYAELGGKSPLLELTQAQAEALTGLLKADGMDVEVFVAMRYWHLMAIETAEKVKRFGADRVVLLPLYPQFSTTTSASSFGDWHRAAAAAGIAAPTTEVCCYPMAKGFVAAQAAAVGAGLAEAVAAGHHVRVLFSAHGLPKKVIRRGDPYQWQVEQTAAAVVEALAVEDLDWTVCYQSRVGRLEWIGPSTDDEIGRAAAGGVSLVVVPIAFVSEHSETLVELDIEYRKLALEKGVVGYHRVPALGTQGEFISALADLARRGIEASGTFSETGGRLCPNEFGRCPLGI